MMKQLTEVILWLNGSLLLQKNLCMFPRQLKYLRIGGSLSRKCFTTKGENVFLFCFVFCFLFLVKGDRWSYQKKKKTEWLIVHCKQLRILKEVLQGKGECVLFLYFNSFYLVDLMFCIS